MKKTRKKYHMSEKTLVGRCVSKLKDFPSIRVCLEVPILGRSADIAYIHHGELCTVEFKIHDWRRALTQARDHLLGSDYSYICMPERKVSKEMRAELTEMGVGLVFYREGANWPFDEVIKARHSIETWDVVRAWAFEYIEQNEGKV